MQTQKITPFLWYSSQAEEAAAFYASIFPDSRVTRVTALPSESPSGPPGSVKIVEFVLFGQPFTAMSAGPLDPFNHAVSFVVSCESQAEVDRYWNALFEGGSAEACGWLKDRYGLSWQILPTVLGEMMSSPDGAKAKRAAEAMMKMVKIDIAELQAAFSGAAGARAAAR
jgi:predicted 3-demethylubiquinone-9 3-methyltransferase (glyoxalase superfamily)